MLRHTKRAKEAGQNQIAKVYSSPMTVKVNGVKIGTIELNGDNIEIVTAFLGVLELGKLRQVDIDQKYLFSDINVTRKRDNIIDIDSSKFNY